MSDLRRPRRNDSEDLSPPRKAPEAGGQYGIISAQELKEQLGAKAEADRRKLMEMDGGALGRDAKTVYRDRATGKVIDHDEFSK